MAETLRVTQLALRGTLPGGPPGRPCETLVAFGGPEKQYPDP